MQSVLLLELILDVCLQAVDALTELFQLLEIDGQVFRGRTEAFMARMHQVQGRNDIFSWQSKHYSHNWQISTYLCLGRKRYIHRYNIHIYIKKKSKHYAHNWQIHTLLSKNKIIIIIISVSVITSLCSYKTPFRKD